jgi:bifunctional non-homologous end joining protein LigD
MKEATRSPIYDRRLAPSSGEDIVVGDLAIPRRGDAPIVVDGHRLALTNLDRLLYPEAGFTKADVIAYYLSLAEVLLPHLRDRPLTVGRFPGGVDGRGFAQAEVPGRPAWMRTVPIMLAKGEERAFTLVEERATLAWLAQMGTIELHTFLGRGADLEHPTQVVFDLDPTAPAGLIEAAEVALRLHERLAKLELAPLVKTSGSVGMHVVVPLEAPAEHTHTRAFAQRVAKELADAHPETVSDRLLRAGREGKVLVDARQNAMRLTMVVPYSLRSTPRPRVSTPVTWSEVEAAVRRGDGDGLVFEASEMVDRVARMGDLFAPALGGSSG